MPTKAAKPAKPYPEFPLTANGNGQWSKKIAGTVYYFGPWEDWRAALNRYQAEVDSIRLGKRVFHDENGQKVRETVSVADVINSYLTVRQGHVDSGELKPNSFKYLVDLGKMISQQLGRDTPLEDVTPEDFAGLRVAYAERWPAPETLGKAVNHTKTILRHAEPERGGLLTGPVRFGHYFTCPSQKAKAEYQHRKPEKMFEAAEIRAMLAEAERARHLALRAMVLLGVNCGFHNEDCGSLEQRHLREYGWHSKPRNKTGQPRRCPLWDETMDAIEEYAEQRPEPRDSEHSGRVFVTKYGRPWASDRITNQFGKLMSKVGCRVKGRGFQALRHNTQTIGEQTQGVMVGPSIALIMGHKDTSMAGVYRERPSDVCLSRVTDHVRNWLYAK